MSNNIKQAGINLESGKYNSETIRENISLQILDAFLQVLYTEEQVKNSEKQVEATTEELQLAEERLNLSIISRSDYLQVKSELASEKLTLANAKSTCEIAKISLMQLMELPVDKTFEIVRPDLEGNLNQLRDPDVIKIYQMALNRKPQVKNAELNKVSAEYDEKIARADFYPTLSASAGLGTGYSSCLPKWPFSANWTIHQPIGRTFTFDSIFQKNQVKSNIKLAKIGIENAGLNEIDVKNLLRKSIEQACCGLSLRHKFNSMPAAKNMQLTEESYRLAEEKIQKRG